jgi:hypothetical protein
MAGKVTEKDATDSAEQAGQDGLEGAVKANKARSTGAKLASAKVVATELQKGI